MKNTELSHIILSDHSRIEAAISTGAAWEVWFQVEFLMLLRAAHLGSLAKCLTHRRTTPCTWMYWPARVSRDMPSK